MKLVQPLLRALKARLDRVNIIDNSGHIHPDAWVSGSVVSGNVKVDAGCKLFQVSLGGNVEIARYSSLWGPDTQVLGRINGVSIGSFCSISRQVSIQEDYHNAQRITTYYVERNLLKTEEKPDAMISKGKITIGNDVWIGTGAQILSGVGVGNGAIIAAGAIVTKDVPPYAVVAGNPATVIRFRFATDEISRLLEEAWWDWPLDRIIAESKYLTSIRHAPN